ncbi:MAG: hypothetical protein K2P81_16565 [Bacteriovoracaceae bacterium]|nr:hypothetical protein [Bacteriovoracaceae bacterium]
MSLSQVLSQCDIGMSERSIQAFCIGAMTADDPMPFHKALRELFMEDSQTPVKFETPAARAAVEKEIQATWKDIEKNLKKRRAQLLDVKGPTLKEEIEEVGRLGDFFLMGLTLAGVSVDDQDDQVGALLDEMEDHLLLLDEWVADEGTRKDKDVWMEEGQKYRRELSELWGDLQESLDLD